MCRLPSRIEQGNCSGRQSAAEVSAPALSGRGPARSRAVALLGPVHLWPVALLACCPDLADRQLLALSSRRIPCQLIENSFGLVKLKKSPQFQYKLKIVSRRLHKAKKAGLNSWIYFSGRYVKKYTRIQPRPSVSFPLASPTLSSESLTICPCHTYISAWWSDSSTQAAARSIP
jgi:hypothetical protein